MIKVSDYIAKRLSEIYNVRHIFLISGGGAMHLNDSFGKQEGIEYICNHHEQASAIAAEGYARYNQELAVVNVTTGPGGINALNGVFGQWTDSVPVLYISGQVKFETTIHSCPDIQLRQLGDQEVDIISCVKPITKYAKMVTNPNEIKYHIDKAIYLATTGRKGPVWLDIPMNVQGALINEDDLIEYNSSQDKQEFNIENSQIQDIVDKLINAKRPLIIAGNGLHLSKTENMFRQLLKKLNIPVVTTFNAVDILENDHPNFIGRIGTVGQRAGNFALQNADLVLCLGTRNNIRQVSYNWENFAHRAFKIVIDIDKAELNKSTVKPDFAVNADLADFIPALLNKMPNISKQEWIDWCSVRKEKYSPASVPEYQQNGKSINPYYFIRKLTEQMTDQNIMVTANGSACVTMFQAGIIKKGQRVFWNSGDASMGYDLPAAIGACIASDKKDTLCIAGDGSIMMNLQELQTIKHYNLPIKIFILNNNGYVSIKQTQTNFFEGRLTGATEQSGVSTPDFVRVANAFDIPSVRIDSPDNLHDQVKKILTTKGPILCDVILSNDYIFSPKLSSEKLPDGRMISKPLEDMYPFLNRDEFVGNMINE